MNNKYTHYYQEIVLLNNDHLCVQEICNIFSLFMFLIIKCCAE